ncbi:TetR family transcriptional regulator [Rhodobacterales bacterium HKCCSP123]|nr:TetR family transcriptional regulator [Rhodobacterales bacterium HKCCSP123]
MNASSLPRTLTERTLALAPERSRGVLVAAYETFLQFGVRRASMQDIADRAGISRAALYLHYRNKTDIFRALMAHYHEAAASLVAEVLADEDTPATALRAAFAAQTGDAAVEMMASPHAEELLSLKQSAARDVIAAGHDRLADVYATWMQAGVAAGRMSTGGAGPDPHVTAQAMLAALDGLKPLGIDREGYAAARDRLADLFGRALTRQTP